jgi:hypothetical protein
MTYMRVCEQGDNMSGTHIRHYTAAPAPIDVQVDVSVAGKHTGRCVGSCDIEMVYI